MKDNYLALKLLSIDTAKTPMELIHVLPERYTSLMFRLYGGKSIKIPTEQEWKRYNWFVELYGKWKGNGKVEEIMEANKYDIRWIHTRAKKALSYFGRIETGASIEAEWAVDKNFKKFLLELIAYIEKKKKNFRSINTIGRRGWKTKKNSRVVRKK